MSSVCLTNFVSRSIVDRVEDEIENAMTVMHELGHTLGMEHNGEWSRHGVPENYCIISKSSKVQPILRVKMDDRKPYAWTICNRCDLLVMYQKIKLDEGRRNCLD